MISFFRTILMYIVVIISMRCMGKRQIGQLQPYEIAIALMIADLAVLPMEDNSVPILNGIIPILSLILAQIVISYLLFKNGKIRRLFCGKSKTVIRNGRIDEEALSGEMYTVNDLMEALRLKDCSDISTVKEARLETNGELSVIPYGKLVEDVIICGKIIEENYKTAEVDGDSLIRAIKLSGGKSIQDVLYAGAKNSKTFIIQLKQGVAEGKDGKK